MNHSTGIMGMEPEEPDKAQEVGRRPSDQQKITADQYARFRRSKRLILPELNIADGLWDICFELYDNHRKSITSNIAGIGKETDIPQSLNRRYLRLLEKMRFVRTKEEQGQTQVYLTDEAMAKMDSLFG